MKLLIAGGGTGGHVIPALTIAREFRARAAAGGQQRQVLFVGTARGMESRLVPPAGFQLELLEVGALQGQGTLERVKTLFGLPGAIARSVSILNKFQPDVVLGVGGYAAGPLMLAAALCGVPLAVYEPNAHPGLANRWVARLARRAFVNFAEAARVFGPAKTIQTGIPVRAEFFSIAPKQHTPPYTVLIFGGSQGARSLNRAVVEALPRLAQAAEFRDRPVRLVMQTGQSEYNRVREAVEKFPGPSPACRHEAFVFMDRMWETFAQADLIVCRAGATTVAELAAAGRAAVLVPYPAAANQHQLRNAEALVKLGAARLLLDQDLSGARLAEVLAELLSDTAKLAAIESAIRHEARPNACGHIVDELEKLVARK